MRDDLRIYYEKELTYLRQMGADFAEKYPAIASRLLLEPTRSHDPHVERMIEAFAFLAARVHLKIDDDFPEITEALLSIVYPHYIRPIPSMSIVEFHTEPGQSIAGGLPIPNKTLLNSRKVKAGGFECNFRTCYETTLWPITVTAAQWTAPDRLHPPIKSDAVAAIRLELQTTGDAQFSKLPMDSLRFFLNGERTLVNTLYELLNRSCSDVLLRDPTLTRARPPIVLPRESLQPVGFGEDEEMIPYPRRSFAGYRLLTEYFTFPEKFFFMDLRNLRPAFAALKDRVELIFLIKEFEMAERRQVLEIGVSAKTFKLGCVPIVNLFPQTAEPILMDQRKFEYSVTPDIRRPNATEIFSVDEVVSINPQSHEIITFEPFYSFRHSDRREQKDVFWIANRRQSTKLGDDGTNMVLQLVDLSTRTVFPEVDTLTVRTTCTNRDLTTRLPFGNEDGDFWIKEGGAAVRKIICLTKPTNALRPPVGRSALWRLISQLSLNYLSLVEDGKEALQEILKLYNFMDSAYSEQQIKGIADLRSRKHFARVISENGITFARGVRVEMELDEEQFVGGGSYLFGSVLEHFLGMYASLNSFSQLIAKSKQRRGVINEWPPRAGHRILM